MHLGREDEDRFDRMESMKESQFVFAYGSNMDPAQMRERCPESDLAWFVAEARGWQLCFPRYAPKVRKCAVGSITQREGGSVRGVVFAISSRDIERLDRYEGSGYERIQIDVHDQQGFSHRVWTYSATLDGPKTKKLPSSAYISLYLRGAEYFGLPKKYQESLKRIKTQQSK